jgi:O-antigen/teichoic acid export membrane protein
MTTADASTRAVEAPRRHGLRRILAGNVVARLGALLALAAATVLVARVGGSDLVGGFTLLRVLPGLVGVLAAAGLPGASPYYLSRRSADAALRPTLVAMTVAGSTIGALCWLALTPVLHAAFFSTWSTGLTAACAAAVFTQLFVATGKSLLQGSGDLRGANVAIVGEEAAYLPIYLLLIPTGHGMWPVLIALILADVLVTILIAVRLRTQRFFTGWGRPDRRLGREICGYGTRGQLGGLLSLVNLRLDVAILGAIAGPAVLGVYAIASKYAELLRLPGLAVTYVLYPVFSRLGPTAAARRTRTLILPVFGLTVAAALPLAIGAHILPWIYGTSFTGAVHPTWILLGGLVGDGVAGLISAYLYGVRRPGMNSLAIAAGVIVTVVGDLLLIGPFGVMGAAVASALAYLTTSATLLVCFYRVAGGIHDQV